MHWGSRKTPESSPHGVSADHKAVVGYKKRVKGGGVKTLSNEELRAFNDRKNLEEQYRKLSAPKSSKFETGHEHVKKVLGVVKTISEINSTVNTIKKQFE